MIWKTEIWDAIGRNDFVGLRITNKLNKQILNDLNIPDNLHDYYERNLHYAHVYYDENNKVIDPFDYDDKMYICVTLKGLIYELTIKEDPIFGGPVLTVPATKYLNAVVTKIVREDKLKRILDV